MKKASRIYRYAWAMPFIVPIVVMFISFGTGGSSSIHHNRLTNLSESPAYIEKVLGLELPTVELSKSDERSGSQYISYIYELKFNEPLSEGHIAELERLCTEDSVHWRKTSLDSYLYAEDLENGDVIDCLIYNDHMDVGYSVYDGEEEVVDAMLYAIMTFAITIAILIVWGIVMLIINFVHKMKRLNQ
jgi:hypothetical protein